MAFHDAINARDLQALAGLMASGHRFIDSAGSVVAGRQACIDAWHGFFTAFPDYRNDVGVIAVEEPVVAMAGRSYCSDARLDGPALWRAVAGDGELIEWQVLEDVPANRQQLGLPG
ncbi:MAG: nuclear transport factor 2 family protein [Novosphingobium sp.]|nr:nuclear transport factor 2 family protein [Novosphingobium sp.]MCP5402949.1 nuclear transport factor 2 family protein [Novosphingobium sp.]